MSEVTVTISGPFGSGKSAIYFEVMVALKALGVEVVHADPAAAQSEINMGFGDTHDALEMYQPRVTLVEVADTRLAGVDELVAACSAWLNWLKPDAPWREDAADYERQMLASMADAVAKFKPQSDFPQPKRNEGGEPCGECRLQPGETCDICGAKATA